MKLFATSTALAASLIAGFTCSRAFPSMAAGSEMVQIGAPVSASVLLPSAQCHGATLAGRRCRRETTAASGYCYQHQWQQGKVARGWSLL